MTETDDRPTPRPWQMMGVELVRYIDGPLTSSPAVEHIAVFPDYQNGNRNQRLALRCVNAHGPMHAALTLAAEVLAGTHPEVCKILNRAIEAGDVSDLDPEP